MELNPLSGSNPLDEFAQDREDFKAFQRQNYRENIQDAKESYAMNQAAENLKQALAIGNKLATISSGAITG